MDSSQRLPDSGPWYPLPAHPPSRLATAHPTVRIYRKRKEKKKTIDNSRSRYREKIHEPEEDGLGSNSRVWKQESLVKGLGEFGSEAVIDAEMGKNEGSLDRCG